MATMVVEEMHSMNTQVQERIIPRPEDLLQDVDPDILAHVVARCRAAGNDAFQRQRYRGALKSGFCIPFLPFLSRIHDSRWPFVSINSPSGDD